MWLKYNRLYIFKMYNLGLPWWTTVENPPCSVGDMDLTPGLGTKIPHAMEQLSPCTTATELACSGTCVPQLESLCTSVEDPT